MRRWSMVATLWLLGLLGAVHAADVSGVVVKVTGQRVAIDDAQGRQTVVSVPPGMQLKVGDRVNITTTMLGDAQRATAIKINPK